MRLGHPLAISRSPFFPSLLLLSMLCISPLCAQTSQPYLFAEVPPSSSQPNVGTVTFFRDDSTGALTLLSDSASTFNDACVPSTIDPKGRFLYSICGDGASMYALNSATTALTEAPNAPFAASQLSGYITLLVIADSSGNYLYAIKENTSGTDSTKNFYIDTFQVMPTIPTLTPISSQQIDLVGAGSVMADPNGYGVALFVNQRNSSGGADPNAVLYVITFDPVTGLPNFDPGGGQILGQNERAIAISPTGNYLALTYGVSGASLVSYTIAQNSFTLSSNGSYFLGPDQTPAGLYRIGDAIFFNPGGQILYVQSAPPDFTGGGLPFQMFDPSDYLLLPASPLPLSAATFFDSLPDPQGPYAYSSTNTGGISVYYVDPVSGRASQSGSISSAFYPQLGFIPPILATHGPSGGQGVSGPVLSLSLPSLAFSQITAGQSSSPQYITLKNVGDEVVNLNSISLTGPNSTDFQLTNGCNAALAANQACALSVVYSPAAAGTSNASIVVTSNVPQSPQSIPLSGTATAPASQLTMNPASIVFPSTVEGTSSNPVVLTLTNTGGAPLHITSTVIGGSNVPDFSFAPTNCLGALNAGASCTLSVTFTPLATGIRTATWTVTDDAAGSPQVVSISGTGVSAVQIGAAPSGSTTATVAAGQAAQFNLQAIAGNGFNGSLTFTCTGVPFGATCVPPASVSLTSGSTVPFTVSVNTLGASLVAPLAPPISNPPANPTPWSIPALLVAACAIRLSIRFLDNKNRSPRAAVMPATAASLLLIFSGMGCGGGASSTGNSTPPSSPAEQTVATPSIQPAGGTFSASQSVSIADATPGATIYFTTDGSTPTASSTVYSAPFSLTSAAAVKAIATATGFTNSAIASSAFSFRSPAGSYAITVNVTATPAGTTKSLPVNPIVLTLTLN